MNRRPQLTIVAPGASTQEAAAIVAALERFMRDTAPVAVPAPRRSAGWLRAGRLAGVGEGPGGLTPWGDAHPWGSRTP